MQRKLTDAESLRWRSYIDGRIDAGIAAALAERDMHADAQQKAVAIFVADVRRGLRAEFQEQIGQLKADVEIERTARKQDRSAVIDLPALPLRGDRRA